ncbi:hypothetical protein CVT25_002661 [Psilocybe cyanescens]|uniref:Pyridoxamine 5'-phosphate oxidase Alr4036 family FMN-binding domain-containing protein n=1 Tax=Psilocybe cyanescens TaxID=93625 RepID=A0A409WLQ0_PSICY|nr:hypothetical protein CVT25_002661 [Psilocybe cyanescens]
MSSTAAPRWKTAIESALSEYKNQTVIQIATTDNTRPTPRVRSHIFRAFLSHPAHPARPLLLSSTDIRTPKVAQLTSPNSDSSNNAEIAWWIAGTQQQFRVLARVYIVPAPAHPLHAHFKRQLAASDAESGAGLALFPALAEWESQRTRTFAAMSAHMRASWCRPTPGTPLALSGGPEGAARWPTRVPEPDRERMTEDEYAEAKRDWEKALSNFALVVADPYEVDLVDLGGERDRRWRFVKKYLKEENGEGWGWEEEELVP